VLSALSSSVGEAGFPLHGGVFPGLSPAGIAQFLFFLFVTIFVVLLLIGIFVGRKIL
jgi:uncharacterized membrane protein YtjA (UPF0391 family)